METDSAHLSYEQLLSQFIELQEQFEELQSELREAKKEIRELEKENSELREENNFLKAQNETLKTALERARDKIEQEQRKGKRQAAPFRRDDEKKKDESNKRSSGRPKGHKGAYREKPEDIDQQRTVELKCCPHCGGEVSDIKDLEQVIQDLPSVPRVHNTRLITQSGWCENCGKRVRSTDSEQVSTAGGCAGVQLGPNVVALAAYCKYVLGLTYRKIRNLLQIFGVEITPGGIVHALQRSAAGMAGMWVEIWNKIRAGPTTHADETSWYVGRPGWWLWVFCQPRWTLYTVQESRSSDVVETYLEDFSGTLVSDCLNIYDRINCGKQKCYSHHLDALSNAIERLPGKSADVLGDVGLLLKTAMAVGKNREHIGEKKFQQYRENLERWADDLLGTHYSQPGVEKALQRFRTNREHLFTFLYNSTVPPTNNLAERQLRPAVINRKVSCGNKTDNGRRTWQILASVAATCQQQERSFIDCVRHATLLTAKNPTFSHTG